MVRPALRSRSLRRVKIKTPTGRHVVHYKRRRPDTAICAQCKKPLHGIPRLRASRFSDLAKTQKRPERPYGGNLCSPCMRAKMRERMQL